MVTDENKHMFILSMYIKIGYNYNNNENTAAGGVKE